MHFPIRLIHSNILYTAGVLGCVAAASVYGKVSATTKIEQQADGSYKVVPTGKEVTTVAHTNLKAGNKTRPWHKKIKTL